MPATTLAQAAGQSYDKLANQWQMDSLQAQLSSFCRLCLPSFPDENVSSRPIANWLTVLGSWANQNPDQATPQLIQLSVAAVYMYKLLWLASKLQTLGLITTAQANVLLTQFNDFFP